MREYGLKANKRLGQNFLIDRNIIDKIVDFAALSGKDVVLEIGAGLGNITADIAGRAKKVIAVEFDKGLFSVMKAGLGARKNVELFCSDILKFDIKPYASEGKVKVIGNLPYYITTPVLEYLVENRGYIKEALLMVQKELGERLLAGPGSRVCGSISCYLSYYAKLEPKSVVKRTCFFPQPDVDSMLLRLEALDAPPVAVNDEKQLFKIIRTAYNQRRKTLLASLSNKKVFGMDRARIKDILGAAGVSPERRPESLTLEEFARISNGFTEKN
jgi:16S rRNA (adenine1518-N6/adenine1519-N6)-dimethyltransferase